MKNKPIRHKTDNTFKFVPFSTRINNIDIDVFHRVGHRYEENNEEIDTNFYTTYQRWNDLNKSESYRLLKTNIYIGSIQTLPQLVLQKQHVVDVLLDHLSLDNELSLQATLELVVALAQDLVQDFYQYYPQFHTKLIGLLNTKNVECLEWTFTCLAYLFKFLWRYIVKDLSAVFESLIPLLSSSKPQYINNFAADCFAFVARKVKDKRNFLKLILRSIHKHKDGVSGCSRLLLATMSGVTGQFHSCAESFLLLLFRSLADEALPRKLLFHVLDSMSSIMHTAISPKNSGIFWDCIIKVADEFLNELETSERLEDAAGFLMRLVQSALVWRDAAWLSDNAQRLLLCLVKFVDYNRSALLRHLVETVSILLLSANVALTQELSSRSINKILAIEDRTAVKLFFEKMIKYSGLDLLILPKLIEFCASGPSPAETRDLLVKLVLYKCLPTCWDQIDEVGSSSRYVLNFQSAMVKYGKESFSSMVLKEIPSSEEAIIDKLEPIISYLIILPHLEPMNGNEILEKLLTMMNTILALLVNGSSISDESIGRMLFLLFTVLKCFSMVKTTSDGSAELKIPSEIAIAVLPFVRHYSYCNVALKIIEICLEDCDESLFLEVRNKSWDDIVAGLSSEYHQVRLSSAQILLRLVGEGEDVEETKRCLIAIIEAEKIPSTVHDYREKLKALQQIECCQLISESKFLTLPLSYLLGVLYVNFKLLWEPTCKLITSYANNLPRTEFWKIFLAKLLVAKEDVINYKSLSTIEIELPELLQYRDKILKLDDKPDHWNYRNMLWKSMVDFAAVCEQKNRDIVPLFLSFVEDEYFRADSDVASKWNIKQGPREGEGNVFAAEEDEEMNDQEEDSKENLVSSELEEKPKKDEDVEMNEQEEELKKNDLEMNEPEIDKEEDVKAEMKEQEVKSKANEDDGANNDSVCEMNLTDQKDGKGSLNASVVESNNVIRKGKSASKALLAHIMIFGKFKDPNSMYKEPEVKKIYFELLTHKNPEVQKSALDCVMTYKHKSVVPYKSHLYGLIDDKSFKDEITLFRIDTESEMVRPEHRPELMPIVMRILYSKMLNKSGVRTGSKSLGQLRRSMVLRFLAGCHSDELMMYLQMAFRLYTPYIKDSVSETVAHIAATLDLGAMVPPRRLQSSVNLLSVVLEQCGGLMAHHLLAYLLQVLVCIGQMTRCALLARDSVHAGYLVHLRQVRNSAIDVLARFFDSFDKYPWTSQEIDAVFEVFVWPYLEKLPIEGVHSPTSLMKLMMAWSKNQRFFPLLGKWHKTESCDSLTSIMSLLLGPKTHNSVVNAIFDMIERLLTLQDKEDVEEAEEMTAESADPIPPIETTNIRVFDDKNVPNNLGVKELNYGSYLLLPHIASVLERMKLKMSRGKQHRVQLSQRDLLILSRATELVSDATTSETLIGILLPALLKKAAAGADVLCPLLTTIANLMKNVADPSRYAQQLAPVFALASAPDARKLLTQITSAVTKDASGIDEKLLDDLNAWDKRWIDQPDFTRRLDAFKRIQNLVDSKTMPLDLGIIIIYTCFHFLRTEKDMSLRDNASQCLHKLCPAMAHIHKNSRHLIIEQTILKTIASSIRDHKHELVQHEATSLLGCMARECGDLHPILKDLNSLTNKEDLEVDFFENLLHLQMHRRVRALLKLNEVLRELKKPPVLRMTTQFLLPMITQFLCSEKYANKNSLLDAAIEALGTVCKLLPWHQYELILRFYLGKLRHKLEFQKQTVRIIVGVLNAFHFDLSKANEVEDTIKAEGEVKVEVEESSEVKVGEKVEDQPRKEVGDEEEKKEEEEEEFELKLEEEVEEEEEEVVEEETVQQMEVDGEGGEEEEKKEQLAIDRITVMSKSGASKIVLVIKQGLLPQLHKAIAMRSQSDVVHKLNRKQLGPDRDEEDVLRIPIALAVTKLLQKLPEYVLQRNLPGILMKLCTFLKSRLDSVRKTTRETMQKVMAALGPKYLATLIGEMTQLLTRGFHVHVLVYSLHSVLASMRGYLQHGDLDPCISMILEVCKLDLFGNASEEKEVAQIAGRLMEARSKKSYDMFHIMGEFATEKCFLNIVMPLKEQLSSTLSHKVINKITECLRQLVLGLVDNRFVSVPSTLIFCYGVTSESIPSLAPPPSVTQQQIKQEMEIAYRRKPDSYLLPEDPKGKPKVESSQCAKTNAHILVEFGLQLLHFVLKREKLKAEDDPQLLYLSLLYYLFICENASAIAVVVRDVDYYKLTSNQLKALLLYCEQDIHDYTRQATAFSLLKAILGRKLICPELHEVMAKVAELSITSQLDHIRLQARQIIHQFLTTYQLGKKFGKHLNFLITNLDYSFKPGRESALELIHSFITTVPKEVLKKHYGLIFVPVCASLVNDDAPECRQKAAELVTSLLANIDHNAVDKLFDIVTLWMQEKHIGHRRLSVQVCGLFISFEKERFEKRLPALMETILDQFNGSWKDDSAGKYVRRKPATDNGDAADNASDDVSNMADHHLYQLFNMLVKIASFCPKFLKDPAYTQYVETISENAQKLLSHPHEWVRLGAAQWLSRVIGQLKPEEVAAIANGTSEETAGYLRNNTRLQLKAFALDHCNQLIPGVELNEKFLMQCMKNLVFVAEVLKDVVDVADEQLLSLTWLIRVMRKSIHVEVAKMPSSIVVRKMVFHWIAAIALKLDKAALQPILNHMLAPLVRELNVVDEGSGGGSGDPKSTLKQIAKEAAVYVKRKIGADEYNRLVANLTTRLDVRRAERRKERAQLAVTEPELAAKKKIIKQQKKKEQKKRKIASLKGKKIKRRKKNTGDIEIA
ncbi:hypothetical protein LSTR_LSTR010257 [Laodelphax striatellus]|uniref:Uncharacterized protein n=1 Tax=Laodelphax striatellus TaxID=195883 RepID=A0A482XRI4_LAOST|nr:hypothetical protein LSTR_LSTR010257 [Laodelphax striatellus]